MQMRVVSRENFYGEGQFYQTVTLDSGQTLTFDHQPTDAEVAARIPTEDLERQLRALAVEVRALQWAADQSPGDTASQALADQEMGRWRVLRDAWEARQAG